VLAATGSEIDCGTACDALAIGPDKCAELFSLHDGVSLMVCMATPKQTPCQPLKIVFLHTWVLL
jgi:hypothetical protein